MKVSPSEAIYGFMAWLTARAEPITLSGAHDAAEPARLVDRYCEQQGFEPPREGIFPDNLKSM